MCWGTLVIVLNLNQGTTMVNGGYIILARCIEDSEVSRMSPCTRELWLYLLRKVNHTDFGRLRRGQGYFRLSEVQKDLSWYVGYRLEKYSKSQFTKSLRRLNESNMIETSKATHGMLVTICKYDCYQNPKNYESNSEERVKATPKQSSICNIYKNENNAKKKREFVPPSLEEFKSYFENNGYPVEKAITVFRGYDEAGWHDSKGNKIKNWKQKCQHVWFRPENKAPIAATNNSKSQSSYE